MNIHLDPDDQPVAGKESKIFVDIQDQNGRFDPSNPEGCDCYVTILKNGTSLARLSLVSGSSFAQLRYIFPAGGTYQLTVEGKPNGNGRAFQAFTTTFEYYALGTGSQADVAQNPLRRNAPWVVLVAAVLIIGLLATGPRQIDKKKAHV